MFRFVQTLRRRSTGADYWLAGQFSRRMRPVDERALAAWREQLGQASAELWIAACKSDGCAR